MRDTRDVRATGLEGDKSPEIIELINDDADAFGERAPSTTIYDSGGPRWVGPVAAVALVALIAYGVATSASSSGKPKVAPVTSTSVATTTPPRPPPTTVPAPPVPYYAADPPREFAVQQADTYQVDPGATVGNTGYELWATRGATATSGSWFSIESFTGGPNLYAINSYRQQVGESSIAISHSPGGQAVTQFSGRSGASVRITSFGWSDDDLVRLAASINTEGGSVEFTDAWFTSDHRMMSSVYPWLAIHGTPLEQVAYVSANDPSVSVVISVAERPPANEGGATLDRQIALRFLLDGNTPFGVDGHSAVAGTVVVENSYSLATWIAGQHLVTVAATMPVPQLIAIARTVHEVSAADWEGMKFQAARNNSNNSRYEETRVLPVSFGTDAASEEWTIQVAMANFGDQQWINWLWGGNSSQTTPDDTAQINTVVDNRRTYVLADLPRAIAPAAGLQIIRDGLEPVLVRFNDIDPEYARTFAAYAFSEPVTYTAQIIGVDGGVLATWPSP